MRHKVRRDASYWSEQIRLAADHADGVQDYCEKNGIRRQAFYYWKKRLNGIGPLRRGPRPAFAKVEVIASAADPLVGSGRLPDPRWLAEFLLAFGVAGAAR